jgi:hypothetical protein
MINEIALGTRIDIGNWARLYDSNLKLLGINYKDEIRKSIKPQIFETVKHGKHLCVVRDKFENWSYGQVLTHSREISINDNEFSSQRLNIGDVMPYEEIKIPLNVKPRPSYVFNSIIENNTIYDGEMNLIKISSGLCNSRTLSLMSLENLINFKLNLTRHYIKHEEIFIPFQTSNKKLILKNNDIISNYSEILDGNEILSKNYSKTIEYTEGVLNFIEFSNNIIQTHGLEYSIGGKGFMISPEYVLDLECYMGII